jgi:hypothetical protein
MKLANIVDPRFHEALNKLANAALPVKTAFKIKGVTKVVRAEYEKYEEVRQASLKSHGLKKEDGELDLDDKGNVKFDNDGIVAFAKDMADLTALEVEVPTVSLAELGEKIDLTAMDLELLDGIVVSD